MKLTDALLDLLFPPKCPFCRRVLDAPGMCPECEKTLPWTGNAHGLRELRSGLPCAAPLWYEGPVREAVRRFKFHGGVCAAGPLGELIAQAAAERLSGAFDTVAWVPSAPSGCGSGVTTSPSSWRKPPASSGTWRRSGSSARSGTTRPSPAWSGPGTAGKTSRAFTRPWGIPPGSGSC